MYWSIIHGIKRKPHLSMVWNWYHFVAIAILHQPRPTDSADINTRLQLSDTSSIPPMHGGFLLGPHFNTKTILSRYNDSHYDDKMVMSLIWKSYTVKMASLYSRYWPQKTQQSRHCLHDYHDFLLVCVNEIHGNGKVIRVIALVFTWEFEEKLQRLQWIPWTVKLTFLFLHLR